MNESFDTSNTYQSIFSFPISRGINHLITNFSRVKYRKISYRINKLIFIQVKWYVLFCSMRKVSRVKQSDHVLSMWQTQETLVIGWRMFDFSELWHERWQCQMNTLRSMDMNLNSKPFFEWYGYVSLRTVGHYSIACKTYLIFS